jgi:hypothetical protein
MCARNLHIHERRIKHLAATTDSKTDSNPPGDSPAGCFHPTPFLPPHSPAYDGGSHGMQLPSDDSSLPGPRRNEGYLTPPRIRRMALVTQDENAGRRPHRDSSGEISWIGRNFPEVQAATINVTCADAIWGKNSRSRSYTESTFRGELIPCSNPQCYKGFGDLATIIREMVRKGVDHQQVTQGCWGYEGSERVRRRRCRHVFSFTISITYYPR